MKINVLHLGFGRVGREVVRQISKFEEAFESKLKVRLNFAGTFNSKTQLLCDEDLSASEFLKKVESTGFQPGRDLDEAIFKIKEPFILLDTTASDATLPYIEKTLIAGGFVVLSNKKPLSGSYKNFQKLMELGEDRIFFETVVGAGLPVIKTLKEMMATGDEILKIEGCFSGTLGFIFSELQKGGNFSEVVRDAGEQGYTEPDPRDDLSGLDIARKVLILSRLLGQKNELNKIKLSGLVPEKMKKYPVEKFMDNLKILDKKYMKLIKRARDKSKSLRFMGCIDGNKTTVKLSEIDSSSDIGNLKGPDNIIVIKSSRYFKNPLVIKGPGAGIEVTAAGVFADILEAVKAIKLNHIKSNSPDILPATI